MYRENVTTRKTKPHFTVFGFRKVRKPKTCDREPERLEGGGGGGGGERESTFTSIQKVEQTTLLCHQSVTFHCTIVCLTPCFDFKSRPQIRTEIRFFRVKTSIIVYLPYCMNYSKNIRLIYEVGVMAFFRDSGQRSSTDVAHLLSLQRNKMEERTYNAVLGACSDVCIPDPSQMVTPFKSRGLQFLLFTSAYTGLFISL